MGSEARQGTFNSFDKLSQLKRKGYKKSQRSANDTVALKPPHLALMGQAITCPEFVTKRSLDLIVKQRKPLYGLIKFGVSHNAVDLALLENVISATPERLDNHTRVLLADLTQRMAGLLGDDTCPFSLSLIDSESAANYSFDVSSGRLGLFIFPNEGIDIIRCASPFAQLDTWFASFNQRISGLLGYMTIDDLIDGEIESQIDELDITQEEIRDNSEAISELCSNDDESALIDLLGVKDHPWHDREDGEILHGVNAVLLMLEYKDLHCVAEDDKKTFTQLHDDLCSNIEQTPALGANPLIQTLLSGLPAMVAHEKVLSSMWDVFTAEGDAYFGDAFLTFTGQPSEVLAEAVDRHCQYIFEGGEIGCISIDYTHPKAFQTLQSYVALATELAQLYQQE